MSVKENARTAWKEVTKVVGLDKPEDEIDLEAIETSEPEAVAVPQLEPVPETSVTIVAPRAATVIAAGTSINGDISADGELVIEGTVNGNVESAGRLRCLGSVTGNITAKEIVVAGARVLGDLHASEDIAIDINSVVVGNAVASAVLLDGKLKGNLTVSGMTRLEEHAVLVGDIGTDRLSICEGARFSGTLKMTRNEEIANLFH